jgi:hypothetical protein
VSPPAPSSGQTLVKYWSITCQTLVKHWSRPGQELVKGLRGVPTCNLACSNTGQTLATQWLNTGQMAEGCSHLHPRLLRLHLRLPPRDLCRPLRRRPLRLEPGLLGRQRRLLPAEFARRSNSGLTSGQTKRFEGSCAWRRETPLRAGTVISERGDEQSVPQRTSARTIAA